MRTNVYGQTINLLPDMRIRECLNNFESGVRDEWVIVDDGRSAGKYPVGTKKHAGSETVRDSEVHSQGVETIHSRNLDLDRRVLESRYQRCRGD